MDVDAHRMSVVMQCFDKLPKDLREWVSNLHFSLHDDHILRGEREIRECKLQLENNCRVIYKSGNGQN